jgi:serine/threonine-protein kinase
VGPGDLVAQRYRLEQHLGSGGMGAVWAATHVVTGKPVALKVLKARDDDEPARRRLVREARAACAVQHPSVVPVHDVVETDDGSPVLVMDLLEGESLRARLDRERTLPLAETMRVAETVLAALEVAHAAGVVHRDLKPDNLFILRDGSLKLLDFGVAKLVKSDAPAASGTLTATGAMVGTPFYMSPEQAFGEPIDGRADLFSLGVVLYECLAGEPPTRGDNLGQVLRRLTTGDLAPLRDRAPSVPAPVCAAIDALVSVDVAARPERARAALISLREASEKARHAPLLSPSVSAPPPPISPPPPAPRPSARKNLVLMAAAVAALGAVGFAVRASSRAKEPPPLASPLQVTSASATATEPQAAPPPANPPAPPPTSALSAKPITRPAPTTRPATSTSPSATASPGPRLMTDVPF